MTTGDLYFSGWVTNGNRYESIDLATLSLFVRNLSRGVSFQSKYFPIYQRMSQDSIYFFAQRVICSCVECSSFLPLHSSIAHELSSADGLKRRDRYCHIDNNLRHIQVFRAQKGVLEYISHDRIAHSYLNPVPKYSFICFLISV